MVLPISQNRAIRLPSIEELPMIPEKIKNSAMDWKEHKSTYNLVVAAFKFSTIAIVTILAGMVIFLV